MQSVLIADDNEDNLYYLQALFGANGYGVATARNGAEALNLALTAPPSLVIADILMPVMDGFTLCKRWRADPQLAAIPFVFYTATYTDPKDRELGLSIGADEFLTKPQEPEALIEIVRRLLSQREAGTLPDRASVAPTSEVFLREYNAALIRKLEDKLVQLEKANQQLVSNATRQKKLEEQLWQTQKLEAIGQLAAGVAHDFNNLLSIMVGYSELIRGGAEPQSQLFQYADQIRKACSRATSLTGQLLAFSRRQILLPSVIDLRSCLEEMKKTLRRLTREDIELQVNVGQQCCHVLCDPVQVEQVVLNLATNACYAMPNGGRLSLDLSIAKVDDCEIRNHNSLRPAEYVRLTVSDTGIGMDAATMKRIFEPFFTTKPVGEGTGLGLASAHGIVEQSGGAILVSSRLGVGTTFEVYLPRVQASSADSALASGPQLIGGSEAILVAEDDESLRTLLCEMLADLGYRVLPTASARDALRAVQDVQERLDLLITDVIMPQMNGRELSELAWSARPALRVLYVSGYGADLVQRQGVFLRRGGFLAKPFSRAQLATAVRALLDT
jgi:signal transduction histidine kinase